MADNLQWNVIVGPVYYATWLFTILVVGGPCSMSLSVKGSLLKIPDIDINNSYTQTELWMILIEIYYVLILQNFNLIIHLKMTGRWLESIFGNLAAYICIFIYRKTSFMLFSFIYHQTITSIWASTVCYSSTVPAISDHNNVTLNIHSICWTIG